MKSTIDTLGALHLSVEHKRGRTSALRRFDGKRWQETPDRHFHRDILRLAIYLHERVGVSAGDRVVLLAPLSPEWLVVDWATVTQGAVSVVLDPALSDAALAAAWERFAPVAAFVDGPEELRRVLAMRSRAGSIRKVVAFRPGRAFGQSPSRSGNASPFERVLELGGALSMAPQRARAFRDRARALAPVDRATVHARPGSNGSPTWEMLTHGEVLARWLHHEAARMPCHGDTAYAHRDALTARAHVALYGLLGDGLTSTALATPGCEDDELERLAPCKVVCRSGVVERSKPSRRAQAVARVRTWLDRVVREAST